jgi:hypothetical protein
MVSYWTFWIPWLQILIVTEVGDNADAVKTTEFRYQFGNEFPECRNSVSFLKNITFKKPGELVSPGFFLLKFYD